MYLCFCSYVKSTKYVHSSFDTKLNKSQSFPFLFDTKFEHDNYLTNGRDQQIVIVTENCLYANTGNLRVIDNPHS